MVERFDIPGAPDHELARSPAAAVVGRLAARSGLLMAHFEHRVELELPEHWLPADRPDLGESPRWIGGVLPEAKYQGFRHDRLIGSFHPGHRAKWTAHELCHALVGFAWRPGASRFFHALAARLAEALPVALYYFYDEASLARCADHQGGGPLYGTYCVACEQRAAHGPAASDAGAERWLADGSEFLERELAAVMRSAREGRLVENRLGTLDLASDGLAYAAAHADRLDSDAFQRWVERFAHPSAGWHDSLDSLHARTRELEAALTGGAPAAPLLGDRWRWIAQDLGWRLLQVLEETEGHAATGLLDLVDRLAAAPDEASVSGAVGAYAELAAEFVLPAAADVLAVGYDLPGTASGRSLSQVEAGLRTAVPVTLAALGERAAEVTARFVAADSAWRQPLGRRFAKALRRDAYGEVAAYEAALAHAAGADAAAITLAPIRAELPSDCAVSLARGAELLRFAADVPTFVEAALAGQAEVGDTPAGAPVEVLLFRGADGDVAVLPLDEELAEAVRAIARRPGCTTGSLGDSAAHVPGLMRLGVVVPERYDLERF